MDTWPARVIEQEAPHFYKWWEHVTKILDKYNTFYDFVNYLCQRNLYFVNFRHKTFDNFVIISYGESFTAIERVKQGILSLYEDDLKKYDKDANKKASLIFKTIPKQLSDHGMHFTFSEINTNARYINYVESVELIAESMIGNLCANVTTPDVLLDLYADRSNFKLYMGDTGLLVSQMIREGEETEGIYRALIFDKLSSNLGMIFENAVAQMLRAKGTDLFFHEFNYTPEGTINEKKYEVDFLLVRNRRICPVEVKSSGYSSHKSFDYFVKKYPVKIPERYIIYTKDLKTADGITFIPAYMTSLL